MGKGNGSTRASASNSPRGLNNAVNGVGTPQVEKGEIPLMSPPLELI